MFVICISLKTWSDILHLDRIKYKIYNALSVTSKRKEMACVKKSRERLIAQLTEQLPAIRARLNLSQDDLAIHTGISRQTVSLIETGKQTMTWVTFMAMLALFENNKESLSQLSLTGFFDSEDFATCMVINKGEEKRHG